MIRSHVFLGSLRLLALLTFLGLSACGQPHGPAQQFAEDLQKFRDNCAGGKAAASGLTPNQLNCLKCLEIYCHGPGTLQIPCPIPAIIGVNCQGCGFWTFLCDGNTSLPTPGSAQQHYMSNYRVVNATNRICHVWLRKRVNALANNPAWQNASC